MNFRYLLSSIQQTHTALQQQAVNAINRSLTIRNWLIGYYIVEFEQKGEDRAQYGEGLLKQIAVGLQNQNISNVQERELRRYRLFYATYPQLALAIEPHNLPEQIRGTVSPILDKAIRGTVSAELKPTKKSSKQIRQASDKSVIPPLSQTKALEKYVQGIVQTPSEQLSVPSQKIISRLSFSHISELLPIADPLKRAFYEIECMKGTWSVRELRRQINSLHFERSGLSKNPEKLSAMIAEKAEPMQPTDIIKSVYTFEFLGLHSKDVIEESNLETALLNHLQDFLIELGHGFCFEARQQKILIGDEYFFIDLVFYHRILKCHILIDLKVEEFTHNNAGQLNTYLNYYKAEVAQPNDNAPVGILLVTDKNKALVEYATAGMDNKLFVSKYLVQLPSKEELQQFVQNELRNL